MNSLRERVLDLLVRWEEARARGSSLSPEELCRDCPDLLDEFLRRAEELAQVDWLNEPIEGPDARPAGTSPPAAPGLPLPRVMAERYRLEELIGEGGFGQVYRGFDTWLERPVAIKVPRIDRPVTGAEVDQCRLEARKVARLKHPNIVPVHDVGRDGGTCFIVSEWIDGTDLQARIEGERPGLAEAVRIVAEVAEALGHAHRLGFVHRDIKPANILLDRQGRAFLTDFGIAVVEEDLLRDVSAAGTPAYMAPEQLSDGLGPADHRADLYALGVVFHELLTGRRPSPAHDSPSSRALDESIPAELRRICLHCLGRRPDDRYQEADRLAAELRLFLDPLASNPGPPTSPA